MVTHQINAVCDDDELKLKTATASTKVSRKINHHDQPTFNSRKLRTETAKDILCDAC
ncbi:protein of unknown function [Burkholderia multivorans]